MPATGTTNTRACDPGASIVLVGCRGAGKRTLGFMGASYLRRRLVIEDHHFERVTGLTKGRFLAAHGKDAFNRRSMDLFKHMLDADRSGCVVVCGMSSLVDEAQDVLRALCRTHPVVYVRCDKEHISRQLDADADADAAHVARLLRADEKHRDCSNLEYYNLLDEKLLAAREDFSRFLDFVTGRGARRAWIDSPFSLNAIPPEFRAYSYALRLRLSSVVDMHLAWEDFEAGADCVEYIVDHWPDDLGLTVSSQLAQIRRKLGLPIIYHVEQEAREPRRRPPEEENRADLEAYQLGLRLGVDYISLDVQRDERFVNRVFALKGRSKVIGNYWYLGLDALPWTDPRQVDNYKRAAALGCDIVRMIRFCPGHCSPEQVERLRETLMTTIPNPKPQMVAYDFSALGVPTPLQSRVLAPVKHPDLDDDGDRLATVCTYPDSLELLFRQSLLDPLQFYVLGANVGYSLSPAMHTAAYAYSGMHHTFQAVPCATLDELHPICRSDAFGGASLTAPFKVAILPHLTHKSRHAAAIGAVNVVLPLRGRPGRPGSADLSMLEHANARNRAGPARGFYGDNTDWSSILTCLRRATSPRNHVQPSRTTALVVGAGGMARAAIYALIQLGCRHVFLYNRTVEHAEAVAAHFNSWAAGMGDGDGDGAPERRERDTPPPQPPICCVLTAREQPWPAEYQPPTMVISCVPATAVHGSPPADFELPLPWLRSPTGGVVLEAS